MLAVYAPRHIAAMLLLRYMPLPFAMLAPCFTQFFFFFFCYGQESATPPFSLPLFSDAIIAYYYAAMLMSMFRASPCSPLPFTICHAHMLRCHAVKSDGDSATTLRLRDATLNEGYATPRY